MKRGNSGFYNGVWGLLMAWMLALCATPVRSEVHIFHNAHAVLNPDGGPAWEGQVAMPHIWDRAYPGRGGRATYQVALPPIEPDEEHYGLYFPRVGNQVEIRVNGELVSRWGTLGDNNTDATKLPVWVPLSSLLLSAQQSTPLEVTLSTQNGRLGGLHGVQFGTEKELLPAYQHRHAWRLWGAVATISVALLMGIATAGLWWLQREPLYAYYAMAAFATAFRYQDRLWDQQIVDWPFWGGLMAVATSAAILGIEWVGLNLLGHRQAWLNKAFAGGLLLGSAAALWAFQGGYPLLWTLALAMSVLMGLVVFGLAVYGIRTPYRREAIAICLTSIAPLALLIHDFFYYRVLQGDASHTSLLQPVAGSLHFVLIGWVILDRYARQMKAHQELLVSLDHQVRQREQELMTTNAQLQQEHALQATLQERQRIMRDIHDGVGAHLVGLLSLIGQRNVDSTQLREHASAALDELRMAVDAMQPINGDLATVLATLRYRMQPRLSASGIQISWKVDELPPLDALTPHKVLQIQRILLEIFTNVLRHAQATKLRVTAVKQGEPVEHLVLEIEDNGVGMPAHSSASVGHGLGNMRARAQAIGAELIITSRLGKGVRITLSLPAGVNSL